jgi:hypothetical protein
MKNAIKLNHKLIIYVQHTILPLITAFHKILNCIYLRQRKLSMLNISVIEISHQTRGDEGTI